MLFCSDLSEKKRAFLTGTLLLTAAGFLCRLLGFFYRIFLSRTIGAEGLGIYNMVHPVYGICFALCGGSIPDTMTCLEMAASGENDEWTEMYPRMAAEAKEEGFTQLAALFTMVGQIEKEHEARYRALAANLKEGKVFAREEQQVWVCRNCGYTHIGKSAPLKCPVCAHPQSYFELKAKNY